MASRILKFRSYKRHTRAVPDNVNEPDTDSGDHIRYGVDSPDWIAPIIAKGNRFDDVEAIY